MSEGIISQILAVEKHCATNLEEAKQKAENIRNDAKTNSKNYYETAVRNANTDYQNKIDAANENAKKVIAQEISKVSDSKEKLMSLVREKEDKAIDEVIRELV